MRARDHHDECESGLGKESEDRVSRVRPAEPGPSDDGSDQQLADDHGHPRARLLASNGPIRLSNKHAGQPEQGHGRLLKFSIARDEMLKILTWTCPVGT